MAGRDWAAGFGELWRERGELGEGEGCHFLCFPGEVLAGKVGTQVDFRWGCFFLEKWIVGMLSSSIRVLLGRLRVG